MKLFKGKVYIYMPSWSLLYRSLKFWWQRRTRGWSDDVTWNLNDELAKWLVPRLKQYKKLNIGFPFHLTMEEWDEIIDEMIWTFEQCIDRWEHFQEDPKIRAKEEKRYQKGIKLFAKYHRDLWW